MSLTIEDLLQSLQNPNKSSKQTLDNNSNTWSRIGKKDSFEELGLSSSELDSFLTEWINENPYSNL